MRFNVVAVAACVVAFAGSMRLAHANAPAPYSRPVGAMPGMVIERPSPLVVEREELVVDCAKGGFQFHAQCTFMATYFLLNPAANEEEVLGAFYSVESAGAVSHTESGVAREGEVAIAVDGKSASAEATPEQIATMDAIVLADPEIAREVAIGEGGRRERVLVAAPFRVTVAPGARARLVFTGSLRPTHFEDDRPNRGFTLTPILTRHVLVSPQEETVWGSSAEDFLYLVSPLRSWAGDPDVAITVKVPRRNDVTVSEPDTRWDAATEDGIQIRRTVVKARARKNLRFRVAYNHFAIVNGGPLLGVGPRIAREELRVRAGYELSGPDYMIYGVAAETNFDTYVTAVATAEIATPNVLAIFPSFALGLGVPVQFRRAEPTRVGGRGELTLSFPLVSFLFPVDFYPVPSSSGSHWEGAFITQLSF